MEPDDGRVLNIVAQELQQSAGGNENEFIDQNRKDALAYYLGQKLGTEVEGRSQIVSTDVADAIEWIMPEVMEQLTKAGEIVSFDAIAKEDEDQAALESRYVYDILMKQNDGFLILHQSIKDALMQKNGIIKCTYEVDTLTEIKHYTGLNQEEYQYIQQTTQFTVVEESVREDLEATDALMEQYQVAMQQMQQQYQQMAMQAQQAGQQVPPPPEMPPAPEPVLMYDLKVNINTKKAGVKVRSVPPEEFRINRQHNTSNPREARFTAHVVLKSASELIKSGIPREVVDILPRGEIDDDDRDYRFYMQDETVYPTREVSNDASQFLYEVAECYMWIDVNDDGLSEFMKIEVAGGDSPTHILRMEEISITDHPFTSVLAILMSHKFFGLSIYDRLRQLQDQKTALWRNIFDNLYLQNNQRVAVLEGQVNLDDLLVSRPGGIVRQRVPGAVEPLVTPPIGQDAYQMMEYLDQVRAGRVGVNPEGPLNIQDIGDKVGSQGIAQLLTAREAVVGLIIRVIAETGIKPLMCLIRDQARTHVDSIQNFKFRDSWRAVRPTDWTARDNTTVHVGTGSGNNAAQLSAISTIMDAQMAINQEPGQTLVSPDNRFCALKKYCNLSGLGNADAYFIDPRSDEGVQTAENMNQQQQMQQQKEEEMNQAMMQMQQKLADAEMGKAQAELQNVNLKAQIGGMELQIDEVEAIAKTANENAEMQFKYDKLQSDEALKITEIESKERIEVTKSHQQNKAAVNGSV